MRTISPPKRPSVWPQVLLILAMILLAYLAGIATGWYLYRPGGKLYKASPTAQPPASLKKGAALPPQGEPIAPVPSPHPVTPQQLNTQNPPGGQPVYEKGNGAQPLTFYNTLQKGNKELIGTGINPPKEGKQSAPPQSLPKQTTPAQTPER